MAKLGTLYPITSGGTPSRKHSEYYDGGTIPWVKTGDLKEKYLLQVEEKITEAGLSNSSAKIYPPDTVLLAMYGATIGATSILKIDAATNQACAAFIKRDDVLPEYLYAFLESQKSRFVREAVGGAQPNISAGYLKEIDMPLLSLEEQQKIAAVLDKVTDLIHKRRQQLDKLDELVKSRFVEMFGNQGVNEKKYYYGKIDEVAEIYLGLTHTPNYVNEGVKFISAKNTSGDFLDLSDVKYISREEFAAAPTGAKPKRGDILFSRVGSNLGHPVILDIDEELCIFVSLGFLRSKGEVTKNYLKHWMRDNFFAEQVSRNVTGGGQPNLNTGWLKNFMIIVPPMELQKEFDNFVGQVDKQKQTVKKSLEELETLKKSLMQQYFG